MDQDPPTQPVTPAAPDVATPSAPVARRRRSGRLLNVALGGALALAVAGIAFAAGRITAAPTLVSNGNFPGGGQVFDGKGGTQPGSGTANGPRGIVGTTGGPTIEGTVESITDTTLTLKTADGQTIQIALDDSTTYHAQTDASSDDVAAGGKVLVRIDLRAPDGGNGGNVSGPSANDVTVVP